MPAGNVHDVVNSLVLAGLGGYAYFSHYFSLQEAGTFLLAGFLFTLIFSPDRIETPFKKRVLRHRGISHSVLIWGGILGAAYLNFPQYDQAIIGAAVAIGAHLLLDLMKDDINKTGLRR